jgi:apolipoprotein D and lipocalin family protein
VQPFWPLKFDYLVIGLDPQYRWSIVGVPDRSYVWIMARTPQMSEEDYQVATQKIEKLGYDLKKLIKVPHNGQKPKLRD